MAKDQDNIRIFGSDDDTVYLAPLGTTLPTGLGELDPGFEDVGYLGEDGIDFSREVDVEAFKAHQGGKVVRKKVTSSERTIVFRMIETADNKIVEEITDKIISSVTTSGVTTTVKSDSSQVWAGACVVDLFDFGKQHRVVIPRFEVTVSGTETWSNAAMTEREATGTIIGNYTEITGPVTTAP